MSTSSGASTVAKKYRRIPAPTTGFHLPSSMGRGRKPLPVMVWYVFEPRPASSRASATPMTAMTSRLTASAPAAARSGG